MAQLPTPQSPNFVIAERWPVLTNCPEELASLIAAALYCEFKDGFGAATVVMAE